MQSLLRVIIRSCRVVLRTVRKTVLQSDLHQHSTKNTICAGRAGGRMEMMSRLFRPVGAARAGAAAPGATQLRGGGGGGGSGGGGDAAASFRAVTYNILADKWSQSQGYCPPEHLAWSSRWPRIQAELAAYDADVMFLQAGDAGVTAGDEVEAPVFEQQLRPWLDPTYGSLFNPRRLPPGSHGPEEGVTLLWKRAAFDLLGFHAFRFADAAADLLPPGGAAAAGGASAPLLRTLARREEGAVAALLRHRASGAALVAASTHLFWDPHFPDVKLVQAAALCRGVAAFVEGALGPGAAGRVPVIIGGDFNSLPAKWASDPFDTVPPGGCLVSGVYQLLVSGAVGPSHQDHPSHRARARSRPGTVQEDAAPPQPAAAAAGGGGGGGRSPSPGRRQAASPGAGAGTGAAGQLGSGALGATTFDTSGLRMDSMHAQALGREPPLTTRTSTFEGVLDYIFLSRGHFRVLATLEMPYAHEQAPPEGPGGAAEPPAGQRQQQQRAPGGGSGGTAAEAATACAHAVPPGVVPHAAFPPVPGAAQAAPPRPLRDAGPAAALALAYHAAQNRSLFAAQCFAEAVLAAYDLGVPCDDLELSLQLASLESPGAPGALGAQQVDLIATWALVIMLTAQELGLPFGGGAGQEGGGAAGQDGGQEGGEGGGGGAGGQEDGGEGEGGGGGGVTRRRSQESVGLQGFVRAALARYDAEGHSLSRVAALQSAARQQAEGYSQAAELMQQYSRLALLTLEAAAARGAALNRPLQGAPLVAAPAAFAPALLAGWRPGGGDAAAAAAAPPAAAVGAGGMAEHLLIAFMGAVLGSPYSLRQFLAAAADAYAAGLSAGELLGSLGDRQFLQTGGLLPAAGAGPAAAVEINRQLFGRWLSSVYCTFANLGAAFPAAADKPGWAFAGGAGEEVEANALAAFVAQTLARVDADEAEAAAQGAAADAPVESDALAARIRANPEAAQQLEAASRRLAEEVRDKGTRMGRPVPQMVRVPDPSLLQTSSALAAWRQQIAVVEGARGLVLETLRRQEAEAGGGGGGGQ
ncbi:MAG: hypothetical protein J3K34DRAFT_489391 [Monoraphidium minutum]|nr:MAG: hypothetical protein J3K34DRAFT_489391 [Monoraphidium minutum]